MTAVMKRFAQDKRWSGGNMRQSAARGRYHLRQLMGQRGMQAAGIQRDPGTAIHRESQMAWGAVMHGRRADLTAALHTTRPGCHGNGSK